MDRYIDIHFKAHPKSELFKFINAYKSAGSRIIKKEFPDIAQKQANGQFWAKTFCLLTLGEEQEELIKKYLEKTGCI